MSKVNDEKKQFWNGRSSLGNIAGTNDYLLKNLELNLLRDRVPNNSVVLDIGCGNGDTLVTLACEKNCQGVGIDFSDKMIEQAKKKTKEKSLESKLTFKPAPIQNLPEFEYLFDCVLTERCLINLDNEYEQHEAFKKIMSLIKNSGQFFMIESSIDGLERINKLRGTLELEKIDPPWHNLFFREAFVKTWENEEYALEEMYPFSSTYYFLSRVVYAKRAKDRKEELRYDSEINLIGYKLPPIGDLGPARLWQWRKQNLSNKV